MTSPASRPERLQDAIDWTVFALGTLALTTAIAATVTGPADTRLAQAAPPAAEQGAL